MKLGTLTAAAVGCGIFFCVTSASATTYTFDVLAATEAGTFQNTGLPKSLNSFGTVVSDRNFPFPAVGSGLVTISNELEVDIVVSANGTVGYRPGRINNAGQILTARLANSVYSLVRIETDGTQTELLAPGTSFDTDLSRMNNLGDVTTTVLTSAGNQIVKIASDGAVEVVADSSSISIQSRPQINDQGVVAFIGSGPAGRGIYTSSGAPGEVPQLAVADIGAGVSNFDIDNNGNIVLTDLGDIYRWTEGSAPTDAVLVVDNPSGSGAQTVTQLFTNDAGSIAFVFDNDLIIDGQRVVGEGDDFLGETIRGDTGAFAGIGDGAVQGFNEVGQALIRVSTDEVSPFGGFNQYIVRVNPDGTVPENPRLPTITLTPEDPSNPTGRIRNVIDIVIADLTPAIVTGTIQPIPSPTLWVDPVVATGFVYSLADGAPNFASLILPDPLGISDGELTLEFLVGGIAQQFAITPGDTFDFTSLIAGGVETFSILDIDPGAGADPSLPFTVGLTFVEDGFSSTLFIDAITVDTDTAIVPIPAGGWLLGLGLVLLGSARKLRREI